MKIHRTLVVVPVALCTWVGAIAMIGDDELLFGVRGGMSYDKWWAASGLPEPQGNHPLYPPEGQYSGPATWRCKECHGWDYKGKDGAYGSGSHYTGIKGVFGSTLSASEMFDLLKYDHGYQNSGLTDTDFWELVTFLQNYVVDTNTYIDADKKFIGDVDEGRYGYLGASGYYSCNHCHEAPSIELASLADSNPWEVLHKIRIGDAGGGMPSWLLGGHDDEGAASIGAYMQADFPGPAYAGDQNCMDCHADYPAPGFFEGYKRSGHPWKIFRTAGETPAPDTWPWSPVPPLPVVFGNQLQWSNVEYVIGNFFWKARYIDHNGYIYTGAVGEKTQWNLQNQTWSAYNAGTVNKPFDCGECHTTGYSPVGNQWGLPGLKGTWAEDGVRCEACHGPSSDHVLHPTQMPTPGGKDCGECHYRDPQNRMPWAGGFMQHHQQSEEMVHSPHAALLECWTCHEPHRSTVYNDGGLTKQCTDCHEGDASNNFYVVEDHEDVQCIDCHMPFIGKSAISPSAYIGDVRGHLFQILRAPVYAVDNTYTIGTAKYWKQDSFDESYVTLDYACLGCHQQIGEPLTMQEAFQTATRIHQNSANGGSTLMSRRRTDLSDTGSETGIWFLDFVNRMRSSTK
jgi:Cytochrome c554 and c-prime